MYRTCTVYKINGDERVKKLEDRMRRTVKSIRRKAFPDRCIIKVSKCGGSERRSIIPYLTK